MKKTLFLSVKKTLSLFTISSFILTSLINPAYSLSINIPDQVDGTIASQAKNYQPTAIDNFKEATSELFLNPYKSSTDGIDGPLAFKAGEYILKNRTEEDSEFSFDDPNEFVETVVGSVKSYSKYEKVEHTVIVGKVTNTQLMDIAKSRSQLKLLKDILVKNKLLNANNSVSENFINNIKKHSDFKLNGTPFNSADTRKGIFNLLNNSLQTKTVKNDHFFIRSHHPGAHHKNSDDPDFYDEVYGGGIRYMTASKLMENEEAKEAIHEILKMATTLGYNKRDLKKLFAGYLVGETQALSSGMYKKLIATLDPFLGAKGLVIVLDFKKDKNGNWTISDPHPQVTSGLNKAKSFNAYGRFWAKALGENILFDKPAPDVSTGGPEMAQILQGAMEYYLELAESKPKNWNLILEMDKSRKESGAELMLFPLLKAIYETINDPKFPKIRPTSEKLIKNALNRLSYTPGNVEKEFFNLLETYMNYENFRGKNIASETILPLATSAYFDIINGYETIKNEKGQYDIDFDKRDKLYAKPIPVRELGLITGKSLIYGGLLGRPEATGFGAISSKRAVFREYFKQAYRLYEDIQIKNTRTDLPDNTSLIIKEIYNMFSLAQMHAKEKSLEIDMNKVTSPHLFNHYLEILKSNRLEAALKIISDKPLAGFTFTTQGFGNVGSFLNQRAVFDVPLPDAIPLIGEGMVPLAFSDHSAVIYNKDGFTKEQLKPFILWATRNETFSKNEFTGDARSLAEFYDQYIEKQKKKVGFENIELVGPVTYGNIVNFGNPAVQEQIAKRRDTLISLETNILILAALEEQVTKSNYDKIQALVVSEPANGPTTPDAKKGLADKLIEVLIDTIINGGGVVGSNKEKSQADLGVKFTKSEALKHIENTLENAGAAVAKAQIYLKQPIYIVVPTLNYIYSYLRYHIKLGKLKGKSGHDKEKLKLDKKVAEILKGINTFFENDLEKSKAKGLPSYLEKERVYNINYELGLIFNLATSEVPLSDEQLYKFNKAVIKVMKFTNNEPKKIEQVVKYLDSLLQIIAPLSNIIEDREPWRFAILKRALSRIQLKNGYDIVAVANEFEIENIDVIPQLTRYNNMITQLSFSKAA